jgi:uncharacterized protein involved in outer membrane biogenesis
MHFGVESATKKLLSVSCCAGSADGGKNSRQKSKSFLVLFFKKEHASFTTPLSPATQPPAHPGVQIGMDNTSYPRTDKSVANSRRHSWLYGITMVALGVVALMLLWNWDWFIPLVEARASAALGRRVTLSHLHVHLGRQTTVTADDIVIANPDGFPALRDGAPLARIARLTVVDNVMDYLHGRRIVLPLIGVDQPRLDAAILPDGRNNFTLNTGSPSPSNTPPPSIGALRITGGTAHVTDPKLRTDVDMTINTRAASGNQPEAIVLDAQGLYAGQKLTGHFIGGALLTLRDAAHPYLIDVHVANGATVASLTGTVQNPLNFAGANVRLRVSGPDMEPLYALTAIPFPHTPPFSVSGMVDFVKPRIRVTDFAGRVGSSDIEGEITEDPGASGKPDVTMDLASRNVDLTDLGGFIGTPPGRRGTPGETPQQKQALAQAEHKKTLLPDTPINLPRLRAANIHLKYRGEHIINRYVPFDKLIVDADVVDGRIALHPLDVTVGTNGQIVSDIDLTPRPDNVEQVRLATRFHHLDLSRILQATKTFKGRGIIGGEARIDSTGNSLAAMMGNGNGEMKLVLLSGGNLSALLVDLTGLQFGNALLSALGVPNRTNIDCFVTDLPLQNGLLDSKVFLLDTDEGRITGTGGLNFRDQTLNFTLTTRSKHFSIGSLPGPINITGPLGDPSITPGTEVVARAGAAAGLGVLLTPLGALLPTIQFGVGNDNACTVALAEEHRPLTVPHPMRSHTHGRRRHVVAD